MNIGYKKLQDGWIAKLQIIGQTNEHRKDIINSQTAKYRCNKALVLEIFRDKEKCNEPIGGLYDKTFMYQTGKEVEVNDYDTNIDKACSTGIHYFKSLLAAQMWKINTLNSNYTGPYIEWHDNGHLLVECNYINGELHGPYKQWYNNGHLYDECNYVKGERHGPYKLWYDNGQKSIECNYVNGKLDGPYKSWYEDGHPLEESNYVNGVLRLREN